MSRRNFNAALKRPYKDSLIFLSLELPPTGRSL